MNSEPVLEGDEWADDVPETESVASTLRYKSLTEFVTEQIASMYVRDAWEASSVRWCPRWFEHAEAVGRFYALWRAFEALRQDPGTGASAYWVMHLDPQMREVLSPDGPFSRCSVSRGHHPYMTQAMPVEAPPAGMFPVYD